MRIVAGAWRGRRLVAPLGSATRPTATRPTVTRPTADRVRQALFDMLSHAPWAVSWSGCTVLDAFAGTGALGLEALSRGAARCVFFETDPAARHALRVNIAACGAGSRVAIRADALRPVPVGAEAACSLIFADPPYRQDLIARALAALRSQGWIAADALVVAETAHDEDPPVSPEALLAQRRHGAATLSVWRA